MPASSPMFCFTSNKIESHPCANCRAPMMNVRLAGSNPDNAPLNVSIATRSTASRFIERAAFLIAE
jgi:hypothetical protein